MDHALIQTLHSLLPTIPPPLPHSLISLAAALLAQSRTHARALKPDEEIARTHAVAHLACERSRATLGLTTATTAAAVNIHVAPPCPPRVYKALYAFFDEVLVAGKPAGRRKRRRRGEEEGGGEVEEEEQRTAGAEGEKETVERPRSSAVGKATGMETKRVAKRASTSTSAFASATAATTKQTTTLPRWMMPAIRQVCVARGSRILAPHVLAGVETAATTLTIDELGGWLALLATIHVVARHRALARPVKGVELRDGIKATVAEVERLRIEMRNREQEEIEARQEKEKEKEKMEKHRGLDAGTSKQKEPERKGIWEENEVKPAQIHACLAQLAQAGVLTMEWIRNVPALGEDGEMDIEESSNSDGDRNDYSHDDSNLYGGTTRLAHRIDNATGIGAGWDDWRDPSTTLLPGLGTMDRVDYLSEAKRAEYAVWKKGVLARIEALEGR